MKITDPNKQQHHTFGESPAAERLKREIDNGANYKAAVRILNKGQALSNELIYFRTGNRRYFLQLLREDIVRKIRASTSSDIVKSLTCNVFIAKIRSLLKLV